MGFIKNTGLLEKKRQLSRAARTKMRANYSGERFRFVGKAEDVHALHPNSTEHTRSRRQAGEGRIQRTVF